MWTDVFISHAREDGEPAERVCRILEDKGIRCWIASRDVAQGSSFDDASLEAATRARVVVLILSSRTGGSRAVLREAEAACRGGTPILPVRIEDVAPTDRLAYLISHIHPFNAFGVPLEHYSDELARRVSSLLWDDLLLHAPASAPAREAARPRSVPRAAPPPGFDAASPSRHAPSRPVDRLGLARALLIGVGLFCVLAASMYFSAPSKPPPLESLISPPTQKPQ